MAKKKVEPPVKHRLTTAQIKDLVARWQQLEEEIIPLADELAVIKERLTSDLDVKDAFTFGNITLRIMQGKNRPGLQWKAIAQGLAKRLYPDSKALRRWLQDLARRFPKKATKAYPRLFEFKPQLEETR